MKVRYYKEVPRLGDRVREAREAKGIGQAELARQVGVTRSFINKLESDSLSTVGDDILVKIGEILEMPFQDWEYDMKMRLFG